MDTKRFDLDNSPIMAFNKEQVNALILATRDFNPTFRSEAIYLAHFGVNSHRIFEDRINCEKANNWLLEEYGKKIKDAFYKKAYDKYKNDFEYEIINYILLDDLMIKFNFISEQVFYFFRKSDNKEVELICRGIQKFKVKEEYKASEISFITSSQRGFDTINLEITKPKLKITDNYNDDFYEIHKKILNRLNKKSDKGIVLLYGKPGTGKTSYIRYLISSVNKKVIFLPPNIANNLTNPDFLNLLMENPNSIFVIEDAEKIVMDRETNGYSSVSALLNISDGLLSDCLNIQLLCSFNTDVSKIDKALLRKGRLIAKYEFKELEVSKANSLSGKLGYNTKYDKPTSLTSIYNQNEKGFQDTNNRQTIGFKK